MAADESLAARDRGGDGRLKTTDGLRALAIVAVVLFHSFPKLAPGGFIGVDVFFVISGFIISLIYERSLVEGRTAFATFYTRRVKRLAPAYIVLVACVAVASLLIMHPRDLVNFGWSLIFQGFYAQNIAFWNIGDYFDSPLTKPLLHTWSLAVEEQFYLVFPFFIFAIARFPRFRGPLLFLLTAGSLLLGWKIAGVSSKTSFYWLPTRVWEFTIGIWASGVYRSRPIEGAFGKALVVLGTASIIAAIFLFDERSSVPSLQTILACGGTVAVLLAQNAGLTSIYDAPVTQHLGRISYSWYLWHWPPLALYFLAAGNPPIGSIAVALLILGYGLGWASWLLLERKTKPMVWRPALALGIVAAFCASAATAGAAILESGGFIRPYPPGERALLAAQMDVPPYRCPLVRRLQMWNRQVCRLNDIPGRPVLLIGDSHADRFKTLLADLPLLITKQNCTAMEYGDRPECKWSALASDIKALGVSRLILISHWSRDYSAGQYRRLEQNLAAAGVPVTILLPTPEGSRFDPATYLRTGTFGQFAPVTSGEVRNETAGFRSAMEAMSRTNPAITIVDPLPIICPVRCRFALGPVPIYRDSNHLTLDGATLLAPAIRQTLAPNATTGVPRAS